VWWNPQHHSQERLNSGRKHRPAIPHTLAMQDKRPLYQAAFLSDKHAFPQTWTQLHLHSSRPGSGWGPGTGSGFPESISPAESWWEKMSSLTDFLISLRKQDLSFPELPFSDTLWEFHYYQGSNKIGTYFILIKTLLLIHCTIVAPPPFSLLVSNCAAQIQLPHTWSITYSMPAINLALKQLKNPDSF
jgi:hypothetical protein